MTISSTVRKAGPFTGTGLVTSFPFTFKVFQASDLYVVQTTSGIDTVLTLTSAYTVNLNADQDAAPGGTVNLLSALPVGSTLNIGSQVPQLQGTVLTNNGGFYPSVITAALDKLTILIQQLAQSIGNSLQLPFSSSGVSTTLPTPTANQFLGWNSLANAIQNYAGVASTAVSTFMATVVAAVDAPSARTALGITPANIGAAASGANADITSMSAVTSINGGQLAGLRNRIINGGGLVQQRASATLSASYQYGAVDRWLVAVASGSSVSGNVSLAGGQPTSTTIGYGITAGNWTTGQPSIIQRIERLNIIDLASKTVTISGKIYQDQGTIQNFQVGVSYANSADNFSAITAVGTSGTISVPSATWTPFTYTLTLNAACANGIHVQVFQSAATTAVSKTVLIGDMQLEIGSTATTFEQRPYGLELALCQRYFWKTYDQGTSPAAVAANGSAGAITTAGGVAFVVVPYQVPMRAVPTTVTLYNAATGATGTWRDGGASDRSVSVSQSGQSAVGVSCSTATASTSISGHVTASAEL